MDVPLETFEPELHEMTKRNSLEEKLATLKPTRFRKPPYEHLLPPSPELSPEAQALGDKLRKALREPVDAAVHVAVDAGSSASSREKAWRVLAELEDLAIAPLAAARPSDPQDRVRAASLAVDAEIALRAKVSGRIEPMLDDRSRPIYDVPKDPSPTERAWLIETSAGNWGERYCDTAYLLMRSLHHPAGRASVGVDPLVDLPYIQLAPPERDRAIQQARASGVYVQPRRGTP